MVEYDGTAKISMACPGPSRRSTRSYGQGSCGKGWEGWYGSVTCSGGKERSVRRAAVGKVGRERKVTG